MTIPLTAVRLLHSPDRADAWLRFGRPVAERYRGRRGIAWFSPGRLFGYVDWRAGEFGTVSWTLAILRAGSPGDGLSRVGGVDPGAELIFDAKGKAAVGRAFALIDVIEASGIDPADVDPDYWRSAGNRIACRQDPRPFDHRAHEAALARRALLA